MFASDAVGNGAETGHVLFAQDSLTWPTANAQRIQRTVLSAKEVPPNAKILTLFDTIEPRIWLPVGVNKSELRSDCAEGGKGVVGLSDCYNQHRRSALL